VNKERIIVDDKKRIAYYSDSFFVPAENDDSRLQERFVLFEPYHF
jgi:hypothetical protein